jgi:hypothetical protein
VSEDDNQRRAEHGRAVFDGAERGGVNEVAGISSDEKLADAMPAENQLRRNAAVGATDDGCSRRLVRRRGASLRGKVDRAELRVLHIAFIARFQGVEGLV